MVKSSQKSMEFYEIVKGLTSIDLGRSYGLFYLMESWPLNLTISDDFLILDWT